MHDTRSVEEAYSKCLKGWEGEWMWRGGRGLSVFKISAKEEACTYPFEKEEAACIIQGTWRRHG